MMDRGDKAQNTVAFAVSGRNDVTTKDQLANIVASSFMKKPVVSK